MSVAEKLAVIESITGYRVGYDALVAMENFLDTGNAAHVSGFVGEDFNARKETNFYRNEDGELYTTERAIITMVISRTGRWQSTRDKHFSFTFYSYANGGPTYAQSGARDIFGF